MTNIVEVKRRLEDARVCLESAERNLEIGDYRVAVQNAQLCVELSAKAVISYFTEPHWTHNPKSQLLSVLDGRKLDISRSLGVQIINGLYQIAEDAEEVAPWHMWSVYGREMDEGLVPAARLATKDVAIKLLESARRSFKIVQKFLKKIEEMQGTIEKGGGI
ncbi:MAG TPA: HEPN domain-containing protein [Syntrophaceae bacterium]|nr:HEPN domain-containing protein [Syntrophaceae bacterium]